MHPVEMSSVYRWLKAFHRGEFEDWDGENDLNDVKWYRSKKIIKIIGKSLKKVSRLCCLQQTCKELGVS
jgi:hypothetical protein